MILRVVPSDPAAVLPLLDQVAAWEIAAGLDTPASLVRDAYAFTVIDDEGNTVGAYALRGQQLPAGVIVWLTAGQGKADDIDLTRDLLPHIERQAAAADYLAIRTLRPGLVKKLAAQGYQPAGTIMVKKL